MSAPAEARPRVGRRIGLPALAAGILLVALLLAGVVSFYAASTPDGLTKVSADQGFASTETTHDAAEGPFAGYEAGFVGDDRLSGGVAGVLGVLVVLVLAGGLALVVRRRGPGDDEVDFGAAPDPER